MEQEINIAPMLNEIEQLRAKIDNIQCEHPYRLNVIDELHINENGHSRILTKLLQYRNKNGKYVFLESLLNYIIAKKRVDFPTKIIDPCITQEEERIDLWIRDKDFAIIMENKACGAGDQETQIYRYVEKTKKHNYSDEQIYIIYLPPTGDKEPSDDSWNGLKDKYQKRYVNLSFRDDIIQWLQAEVIPNIYYKDNMLLTAMIQYCDYLKELFNLNNNDMTNKLNEILDRELNLPQDMVEKYKKLGATIEKYQNVVDKLSNYKSTVEQAITEFGKSQILAFLESTDLDFASNLPRSHAEYGGHRFQCEGRTLELIIGGSYPSWYVQIQWPEDAPESEHNFPMSLWQDSIYCKGSSDVLNQYTRNDFIWRYCNSIDETFKVYKHILKRIVEICDK